MNRPRAFLRASLALILALTACDGEPEPAAAPPTPPSATSRAAGDGITPETHAIVAREGDHLIVIVDVAARDAKGQKVEKASLEGIDSKAVSRPAASAGSDAGISIEVRVPASTKSVKLVGSSEGGATWSKTIPTDLDGR